MPPVGLRKFVYRLVRFTLIDEVMEIICSMLAIYGIFIIVNRVDDAAIMIVALCVYIILVPVVYIFFAKKIKSFFQENSE